ncbi:MAG: type II toxin-antitoxin system Phd/YefM family antitoxin [Planctomycetia bacterium]|nr:type II toxin-antitoxin system Phd/YefM family antitoxin [Planctomycetia bacterium]
MATVTLQEAQATLSDLIHCLTPGEEVVITENDQPVARLVAAVPSAPPRRVPRLGTLRGTVLSMERFDEPIEDFKEYME